MEFVSNYNNLILDNTSMKKSYPIAIGAGIAVIAIAVIVFSISGVMSTKTTYEKTSSITQIKAEEVDGIYDWESTDSKVNPTLNFVANTNNVIEIKNPTDEKHEFVIESNREEVVASGDVDPDTSTQFSFKPDAVGTYGYHCEYHPDTMKGTIKVTAK